MRIIGLKIIALFAATILVWSSGLITAGKDIVSIAEEKYPSNVEPINDKTKIPPAPHLVKGGTADYMESSDSWRTFRHGETNLAYSTSRAPDTNNILWGFLTQKSNSGNGIFSSPAIFNGKVYLGSGEGKLYCLDESTGKEIWNYPTKPFHGMACSPAVANGKVFFGNDFVPTLWAVDAETGDLVWEFSFASGFMKGIFASPKVYDGKVIFGTHEKSARIYCLPEDDPNGDKKISEDEIIWKFDAPDNVWSSAAVLNDRLFIGIGDVRSEGSNKLYCLNLSNGEEIWEYPTSGNHKPKASVNEVNHKPKALVSEANIIDVLSSPAVFEGKVYFGSKDKNVYCLDAESGEKIWSYTTGDEVWSSPAIAYNRVFIGSNDNKLYCLDANTGVKIWDYSTGDKIWSSPSVADGKVYVGSNDGKIYCLDALSDTAIKIWEYFLGKGDWSHGVASSPSIANGKVFIGCGAPDDARLYCFGGQDTTPPKARQ